MSGPADVLAHLEDHFKAFGATHFLATGLPMPGRDVGPLILSMNWADARHEGAPLTRIDRNDHLLRPVAAPFGVLAVRASALCPEMSHHSGLIEAIGPIDQVALAIVPINAFHPYQGLVVAGSLSLDMPRSAISQTRRLCVAAFERLFEMGVIQADRPGALSSRERKVIELSAKGSTAGEIAEILKISQRTVHAHLQNASTKLAGRNKTHTVVNALIYGQIKMEP